MPSMRILLGSLFTAFAVVGPTAQEPPAAVSPVPPKPWATPEKGVRAGSVFMSPKVKKRVDPVYPPAALEARIEGVVILEARIDATGKVTDAKVLRSVPLSSVWTRADVIRLQALLNQAAIDAVKQWLYEPVVFNGKAIPVILTASVTFRLSSNPKPKA